jgi:hypothetical protein
VCEVNAKNRNGHTQEPTRPVVVQGQPPRNVSPPSL